MSRVNACRSCGSTSLETIWDLGQQPIANALPSADSDPAAEVKLPLEVAFCHECALMQVTETVPADILFGADYPYFSSVSAHLLRHSREHALALVKERKLDSESLVVEVASNDGYLLKNFVEFGVPILGIDPANGPAAAANEGGVPTINDFFSLSLAQKLAAEGKKADVILANNVAAHVDTINDFIGGIAALLKPEGFAEIEVAYLLDLVNGLAFDTIYHEHLFYHSLIGFEALANRNGLHLNDAKLIPDLHGGSIRIRMSANPGKTATLEKLQAHERSLGMDKLAFYRQFSDRMTAVKQELRDMLGDLKASGKRIAAYGAAAKGATLLNYLDLPEGTIDYVVDLNPHKVGKLMPGVRMPIRPVTELVSDRPDYVLLLAWNFAREILSQQQEYASLGGKFILPLPYPTVVDQDEEVLAQAAH